ncbi:MAG: nucleoside recognition domain-containing protein [Chitinophagaceae bacterium]
MALNIVWILFFVIAFVVALIRLVFFHDTEIFKTLTDGVFDSATSSVMGVALPLAGTMIFFLGLMNVAEKAGAINKVAKWLNPFMKRLFPGVPENHPAMGEMVMNFSANMLGLDNAATPFGLKAMGSLQELNPKKDTATDAQIMFLVLHTSGLTIIPLSIIAYRLAAGSAEPASVFIACVLGTVCTTIAAILLVGIRQKLKWDAVLIGWLVGIVAIITGILLWVNTMSLEQRNVFSKVAGSILLFAIIVGIIVAAAYKKVSVFDAFVDGAKNGFEVVVKIMPYLVGMLVAIRVFRDCGALGYITDGISWCIHALGFNTDFVPALPVAIMKPFSGSGARGLMIDVMKTAGPDSFAGKLACTFQGSADTTFYILALYFGSVGIKKVRYAVWAGLAADFIGVVAAILISYVLFH